jgi:hypothetical protein
MAKLPVLLVSVAFFSGTALAAADKACPPHRPGQAYPWQSAEVMPGDEWADLYIDLDAKGRPTNCRIGKHKLNKESGFWMCRAMTAQGQFEPVMKDGVAVPGTVTRHFFLAGRKHRQIEAAARKQFFKDHPEERSSCYPD